VVFFYGFVGVADELGVLLLALGLGLAGNPGLLLFIRVEVLSIPTVLDLGDVGGFLLSKW